MSDVFQSAVAALERQQADARIVIDRRQMALRLYNHHDFRKLILEGFCVEECARYARESGNPQFTPEQRADALAMAQAAGHLRRYLSLMVQQGEHAERTLPELEQALAEARAEEGAL
jgi:hypothetical protein